MTFAVVAGLVFGAVFGFIGGFVVGASERGPEPHQLPDDDLG